AKLTPDAGGTLDKIAAALKTCPSVQMEVAGYTDSQGREEMNQQLSQSRAEAVLTALMARRVLVGNLSAKGYGEADPIADNGTEAGREANRRIEFHLTGDSADQASDGESAADAQPPAAGGAAALPGASPG
ncbi:OmpA family protein, partial [Thioclava sp. BHET1]